MPTKENLLLNALISCHPSRFGGINLLLEILSKGTKSIEVTNRALIQMAARSDDVIKPDPYISIGKELGLIREDNRELELTSLGRQVFSVATLPPYDRLNQLQIDLLAPELLGHPSLTCHFASIISRMIRLSDLTSIYRLGSQKLSKEEVIAIQLLQVMGLCTANSEYLCASNDQFIKLNSFLEGMPLRSEEDLWQSLKERNLRARMAEEYVVKYERSRLHLAGRNDLSKLVKRVSEYNVSAGFDVRSFDSDGSTRYIEVKSATNLYIQFFWTTSEMQFAREHCNEYWVYFVPRAQDLPNFEHGLVMLKDPLKLLDEGIMLMEPTSLRVCIDIEVVNDPRIVDRIIMQLNTS